MNGEEQMIYKKRIKFILIIIKNQQGKGPWEPINWDL
jgi:hypothetical protein